MMECKEAKKLLESGIFVNDDLTEHMKNCDSCQIYCEMLIKIKSSVNDIEMPTDKMWLENQNELFSKIDRKQEKSRFMLPSLVTASAIILMFITSISYFQSGIDTGIESIIIDESSEMYLATEYLDNNELVNLVAEAVDIDYTEVYGVNLESAENYLVSNMDEDEMISYLDDTEQEDFINYMYSEYAKKYEGEV